MNLIYAAITLCGLLMLPVISRSRPDQKSRDREQIKAIRSVTTEHLKESLWLKNKRSQLENAIKQPGKEKAECDETCKYVTKFLRESDFFAAAHCTFSTVIKQQGKYIGEREMKVAEDVSENALLHYSALADEIAIEEPRIKIENETEIKTTCDRGEIMPCSTLEKHPYVNFYELKCKKPCKGNSLCKTLFDKLFNLAHEEYGKKYDEIFGLSEDGNDDDYDYPYLP